MKGKVWLEKSVSAMSLIIFIGCGVGWTLRLVLHPPTGYVGYLCVSPFLIASAQGVYLTLCNLTGKRKYFVASDTILFITYILFNDIPIDSPKFIRWTLIFVGLWIFVSLFGLMAKEQEKRFANLKL